MVMLKQLIKLANYYESKGLFEKADQVDAMIASAIEYPEEDAGTGLAERENYEDPNDEKEFTPAEPFDDAGGYEPALYTGVTVSENEVLQSFSNGIPIDPHSDLASSYYSMQKSPTAWNIINLMQKVFHGGELTIKEIDKIIDMADAENYSHDQLKKTTLDSVTYIGIVNDLRKMWSETLNNVQEISNFDPATQDPEAMKAVREYNLSQTDHKKQVHPTDSFDFNEPDDKPIGFEEWVRLKADRLTGVAESIVEDFNV